MKNPTYFPKFKRETLTDLKRSEAIFRKNAKDAFAEAERERLKADEVLREINYRSIPAAQTMHEDLLKMKRLIKLDKEGKGSLSKTRKTKIERAIELLEKNLDNVLLYGGYLAEIETKHESPDDNKTTTG